MPSLFHDLSGLVMRPQVRARVHDLYCGYIVRRDGWGTPCWDRQGVWHVFHLVQSGEIRVSWQGRSFAVTPGQAVVFGALALPRVQWSPHVEIWDLHFALDGIARPPGSFREIEVVRGPAEVGGLVDHLRLESLERSGSAGPLMRARLGLLFALCADAARRVPDGRRLTPHQCIRLARWTQEHLADPPTPADLAQVVGLTPDYFTRVFRDTFDLSPREWLVRERTQAARRMIDEGGVPAAEAMRLTGFRDRTHFSRIIKQVTGRTPGGRQGWRLGKEAGPTRTPRSRREP